MTWRLAAVVEYKPDHSAASFTASDFVEKGIPSIMRPNITTDRISEEGIARIAEEDAERLAQSIEFELGILSTAAVAMLNVGH